MKIFIAAGHGGNDPGAVANNSTERDEVIKIVDDTVRMLLFIVSSNHSVIKVPHNLKLKEEVAFINRESDTPLKDICLEVHMNSNKGNPGTGIETFYGYQGLCGILQTELTRVTGLKDRGVKYGRLLYFNRGTKPGSALIELGFINNPIDLTFVRIIGACALSQAIKAFLEQI